MKLSIVIPVLDEAAGIESALQALSTYRTRGVEVIVVDGGSRDGTVGLSCPFVDQVVSTPRGRAIQMNAGAWHFPALSLTKLYPHRVDAPCK